ncbi:hypothetical protein ACSBOX_18695 [Arthrobacter sp. KN11-1C]|uniref:hypothetical protein n=1 Tax=Arthrobacter sp. KN11-1C TaxID=3445774 RepID=UPI003F9F54B2
MSALLPELIPDSAKMCPTAALPASGAASLLHGVTIVLQAPAGSTVQPAPVTLCDRGFSL